MLHQALCSVICHCHGLASCCERVQQSSMHRLFNVGLGESTWRVAVSELAFATYVEHICRRRRIYTATASVNTFATGQSFHRITIAALLPSSTSFAGSTMITWLPIGLLPLCECGSAVSTYMSFERIPLCVGVSTDTSGTRNAKGLDPVMHACVGRLSCRCCKRKIGRRSDGPGDGSDARGAGRIVHVVNIQESGGAVARHFSMSVRRTRGVVSQHLNNNVCGDRTPPRCSD
jgi:hypothetical protein